MRGWGKYVWAALAIALITHLAIVHMTPRILMGVAMERLGAGGANLWRLADRVTPLSRTIVRPSPDFAYSACVYDLAQGPITMRVAPWDTYWSLSLYGDNSDNYFVIDDREARNGVEITVVRRARQAPDGAARVIESPSERGIALIRRLAPTLEDYNAARDVAQGDACGIPATS